MLSSAPAQSPCFIGLSGHFQPLPGSSVESSPTPDVSILYMVRSDAPEDRAKAASNPDRASPNAELLLFVIYLRLIGLAESVNVHVTVGRILPFQRRCRRPMGIRIATAQWLRRVALQVRS